MSLSLSELDAYALEAADPGSSAAVDCCVIRWGPCTVKAVKVQAGYVPKESSDLCPHFEASSKLNGAKKIVLRSRLFSSRPAANRNHEETAKHCFHHKPASAFPD